MEADKDALLAAMYDDDDEERKVTPTFQDRSDTFSRTKKIRVGAVEYEVPTVEYVQCLERVVARQMNIINHQKREIDRLQGFVQTSRQFLRRQSNKLADMQHDLESKVDYREYP